MGLKVRFALALVVHCVIAACGRDDAVAPAKPELPATPAIPAQYRGAAYVADISSLKKTVRITAPASSIKNPIA